MSKLTDLTEVTTLADGDLAMAVDVSNTSMDATGTNSKVTLSNVYAYIKTKTDLLYAAVLGADDNYVTDAQLVVIGNTSGTNTGDNATNTQYSGLDSAKVDKSTYDAHSVLYATTDNTPVALTVGEQTLVGRATGGNISAIAIDSDLSSVSANDDTVPSAKATKAALDLKLTATDYDDATAAETTTGTSTAKYVSPDGLAGSYAGTKSVSIQVIDGTSDVATGDGKAYITIPEALNGMNLVRAQATVVTAGTTNATTIMIHNKTDAQDMLSGAISIASAGTVGTVGTINGSFDDVATNDVLRIDVDSVSTTAPKGLMVVLEFRLP